MFAYRSVQRTVATAEWKLIWYPQIKQTQMFNLKDDPNEIHDLAGQAAYAEKQAELMTLLKKRMADAGDKGP